MRIFGRDGKGGRFQAAGVAAGLAFALVAGAATPAFAASASLTGTVNCTGTFVEYNTSRWNTRADVYLNLTKAAGSARGGYTNYIGVYLPKTGLKDSEVFSGAPQGKYLMTGFKTGTEFKMRAAMSKSSGTCYNSWAGTLTF